MKRFSGYLPLVLTQNGSRAFSTSSHDSSPVPLKHALRALYKKVHPDLFHEYPEEKAENEKSFKLLQEYLRQGREGDPQAVTARLPFHFIFHLRPQPDPQKQQQQEQQQQEQQQAQQQQQQDAGPAADNDDSSPPLPPLRRVAVTLPPPSRAPGRPAGQLSPTVIKALTRLMSECGVDHGVDPHAPAGAGQGARPTRLLDFLTDALEEARLKEVGGVGAGVRIANIRGAMRLSRQVLVVMANSRAAPQVQLQQLEKLARVLQSVPWVELKGCTVGLLAPRTSLDSGGVLWLATGESEDQWTEFLSQVDLQYARQLQANVAALRRLEHTVAAAVGVATICTAPSAQMAPAFRQLLESLASEAAEGGPFAGGALTEVPVFVSPPTPPVASPPAAPLRCSIDHQLGSVHLPADIGAREARSWMQVHAKEVLAARQQHLQGEAEADELIARTRATLRLRRLLWDRDAVTPQQLRACCREMVALRQPLMEVLEGESVRVSDRQGVAGDGSYVDVKWDFEM